jgi:hypothetical protein
MSETRRLCGVPSERGVFLPGDSQGLHPGLVCEASLGHGVRNRVRAWDWERVDFEAERNRNRQKNVRRGFGEARAETVESIFPSPTGRLRGQRTRLQKNRGARATTLEPQIRNDYAGKFTSRRGLGLFFAKYSEGIALGLGRKTVKSPVGA